MARMLFVPCDWIERIGRTSPRYTCHACRRRRCAAVSQATRRRFFSIARQVLPLRVAVLLEAAAWRPKGKDPTMIRLSTLSLCGLSGMLAACSVAAGEPSSQAGEDLGASPQTGVSVAFAPPIDLHVTRLAPQTP